MWLFSRVEQFHIPARRHWIPLPRMAPVMESFNLQKQITLWSRGNITRRFEYDELGRMTR